MYINEEIVDSFLTILWVVATRRAEQFDQVSPCTHPGDGRDGSLTLSTANLLLLVVVSLDHVSCRALGFLGFHAISPISTFHSQYLAIPFMRAVRAILVRTAKSASSLYGSRLGSWRHAASPRLQSIRTLPPLQYSTKVILSVESRYKLSRLENVEDVENYRSGGFHPIHLGDNFKDGRYIILHKLGHGGFSTVWLARNECHQRLVSLKVLTAEGSQKSAELKLLRQLDESAQDNPWRDNILACLDDFTLKGPDGTHVCYISQPGGPSISAISESPDELAGFRRLRASLLAN